ncbi:hypothetical protein DYB37_008697 [Aphanomyces astaci]|uniref:Uncharacterized protein n=1 Tax=Aphanomyces astaci TaxID=112090 RepID=A0A397A9W3_APHAT|nr:hypothetical protein DYB36_013584 [Aphanomyces astaci]RHY87970.1 hypothetical protein DYB35_007046 [Aphanomyces astaci]RHZ26068.1 hypothetical protein DYB37_008697 [Aphanomyces astaci]
MYGSLQSLNKSILQPMNDGQFSFATKLAKMVEWEEISRWFVKAPSWVPYAVISSAAALLLLIMACTCRKVCCRRRQSNYEAITKDLEGEEREFELGLSSDEDDLDGHVVGFNDEELKQMEMLESYGVQTDQMTPDADLPPLSPTAATTSFRSKKAHLDGD